ncbi:uncharacterized protein GGS22DRAFT_115181 [Annulohypoxylon maeteangense]|uniref:uncharacterized protein n=1 Tax=Annulohypoxylon maeteangense TaxID=1927788 RepID=UPI0020081BCB|nr:uncharacterized protein GGS22DRAFT_115181 [Annulohypoxylon maeteangense]KAI0886563.1 hypothetical protein GGS22DRAFT_115181 [Annulohypoxylon maeteangense]
MSESYPCGNPSAAEGTPRKKRKLRKGTQSCWECKRRKIRCTFAAPTDTTCDGCKSRQTRCISQEFPEEIASTRKSINRLNRIESLVEQLVQRDSADTLHTSHLDQSGRDATVRRAQDPSGLSKAVATSGLELESQATGDLDGLSHTLLEVWPNQEDLDIILGIPVPVSILFHGVVFRPYSDFFSGQMSSSRSMLQPPLPKSHPVLVARKLLLLATFLQGIQPSSADELVSLSSDYHDLMSRVFNVATRLVTSDDELINSLEGIECVMIASMYLDNAGTLRRAWLANRRAMAAAQMMGLHTSTSSPTILESETRDRIDPDYMWFRIVLTDRYLSLMLGLPQGTHENIFARPEALDRCMDVERMERMMAVASSLILQRNSDQNPDPAATRKIDKMLQDAAAMMPPRWWLIASDPTTITNNGAKAFEETVRLMNQFAYYHLLVRVHLPYMMLPSSIEPSFDYSKMIAASASRSIITLFVSFRSSCLDTMYCRGVDFVAFIGSIVLCLAHIEARRQLNANSGKGINVFQSLQHQRLSDRGLLERTLEIMERMADTYHDIITQKISSILRPLLAIEDNSLQGDYYHVHTSSDANKQESQCIGDTSEAFHALHIKIPYFGTIRIEHRPSLPNPIEPVPCGSLPVSQQPDAGLVTLHEPVSPPNQDKGGKTPKSRPLGYEFSINEPVNADWQAVPSSFDTSGTQENYLNLLVPGLEAGIDDWVLQGVDMALFSNLTQGSEESAHI